MNEAAKEKLGMEVRRNSVEKTRLAKESNCVDTRKSEQQRNGDALSRFAAE